MKTLVQMLIAVGLIATAVVFVAEHNPEHRTEIIPVAILVAVFIVGYFLPSIIAVKRGHSNAVPIIIFNVFLGWTLVSWVWCLISACATVPPVQVVHQGNVYVSGRVDHYPNRLTHDDWGRPINYHD